MSGISAVSICSNALLMVGGQTINSLDGDLSDRERLCANLYPTVRDYVLSAHPWNCCRKRVLLNQDVTAPAFDWAFSFTLPPDFARIVAVGQSGEELDYEIENGKILSDQTPCYLRYCFLNQVESTWTPLLVYAVTMSMRQVLAYPVTQSTSLEQLIDQALEPILKRVRAIDGGDKPPETLGDFPLLQSRFTPRGGVLDC